MCLWQSLTFGSSAATYEGKGKCPEYSTTLRTEPGPNRNSPVPSSCRSPGRQGVVALYELYMYKLSRNFREYFRELGKNFHEGSQHNMNGLRN